MSKQLIATGTTRRTPTGVVLELHTAEGVDVVDVTEWLMEKRRERVARQWAGSTGGEAA